MHHKPQGSGFALCSMAKSNGPATAMISYHLEPTMLGYYPPIGRIHCEPQQPPSCSRFRFRQLERWSWYAVVRYNELRGKPLDRIPSLDRVATKPELNMLQVPLVHEGGVTENLCCERGRYPTAFNSVTSPKQLIRMSAAAASQLHFATREIATHARPSLFLRDVLFDS